ncbi:TrbL/VirB6 family protein [Wolbachia endosymbiont of Dirofilaria (Dirofilaria) immitis]|uniref:type IV secretion system protein n=1 Tax=Wolbachia endosymbiont of Dirofilaria (Dirofilaria) immitis TaxID=1812115 RepID=UPI00158DFC80|nr:type IV secretion system protein [Wolbachia endosymbiont of Dirofilaria (Dirofilaria) immitis]QKX02072.1 conjugal transfer protein TrbL [Wolbachia endosymbiont of Dirofilaria (Dirofilaria) immitis]
MHKFLLIATLFLLSGCEDHCIKPESLLNLREKSDVISIQQKWVDSNVNISSKAKVTEISIVPSKISFCPQYEDFAIKPGIEKVTLSKFALKAGDAINFSVIGSKVCKDKENETIRYISIDKKCNNKEKEYFSHILNQNECQVWKDKEDDQYTICPNKYIIGDKVEWLNGKEYWNLNFLKLDQDEREEKAKSIINSIKRENINCSSLSDSQISEVDTHILNLLCGRICKFPSGNRNIDCAYIEYNSIESEVSKSDVKAISNILKKKQVKTDITLLKVHMDGEDFEYIPNGGLCTNCDYKMNKDHQIPNLTFSLCSRNDESCYDKNDKGGFNIRVTRVPNLEKSLYIRVSDKFPKNDPGENQEDISVDISKVHNTQEMEKLKKKLKDKNGTIYYGIRDQGCNYEKNKGQISIKLITKEPTTRTFSAIYNFFDEKVKTAFFSSSYNNLDVIYSNTNPVKSLYESFIKSSRTNTIRSTIISLLVLYIVLHTLYYFLGLTYVSIYEFLIACIKIGIITQLLRDDSWNFFYNNAFSIFINTPKQLIEVANFRGTTSNVFEFLDLPLNRFFSPNSILLIISLIFSGPLGIVAFCLVIWGLIKVVLSTFNALFSFITSIAIVTLLLSLAPIFIICLLFTYTRQMFYNWVKNLARFTIHPAILFIFISLVSQAMDHVIYSMFDFEVCSTCILSVNLRIFNPCIFYGYASKYAPNVAAMIAFVILGYAMEALTKASSKISDSLFSVYIMSEPGKQYQQSLMEIAGLGEGSVQIQERSATQQSDITSKRPEVPQGARSSTPQISQPPGKSTS